MLPYRDEGTGLFELKLDPDLKKNSYIQSISKYGGKIVDSFHSSSKYLTPSAILYLYKDHISL